MAKPMKKHAPIYFRHDPATYMMQVDKRESLSMYHYHTINVQHQAEQADDAPYIPVETRSDFTDTTTPTRDRRDDSVSWRSGGTPGGRGGRGGSTFGRGDRGRGDRGRGDRGRGDRGRGRGRGRGVYVSARDTSEPFTKIENEPLTTTVESDESPMNINTNTESVPAYAHVVAQSPALAIIPPTVPVPAELSDAEEPAKLHSTWAKGLVLEDHERVLFHTSVWTREMDIGNFDLETEQPDFDYSKSVIVTSEEGTLLRVYHHDGSWRVSTHRKLNANHSRWGCRYNFYVLFMHAIEKCFANANAPQNQHLLETDSTPPYPYQQHPDLDKLLFDKLDQDYVYTFLLRNNDQNRLVCRAPRVNEPFILFSGRYPKYPFPDIDMQTVVLSKLPIPIPQFEGWSIPEIPTITRHDDNVHNHTDLKNIVNSMSPTMHQGVIVFHPDGVFKVMVARYADQRKLRNNCPNLVLRYAQIRKTQDMCKQFKELFMNFQSDFTRFENTLFNVAHFISSQYINRYVRKEYAAVSSLQYRIIKKLRQWYLIDPLNHRVTPTIAREFLESETPMYLYKLVDEFHR